MKSMPYDNYNMHILKYSGSDLRYNILLFCFIVMALNAVLIQTVLVDAVLIKQILRIISISGFLVVIILMNRLHISLLLLLMCQVILLILTGNDDLITTIFLLVVIMAVWHAKEDDVLKMLLISSCVAILVVFLFLMLGITENYVIEYRNRMAYGIVGKGSVTFFYNLLYSSLVLCLLYLYKKNTSIKLPVTALALVLATYFYMTTDNRGGYLSVLIFVIAAFSIHYLRGFPLLKKSIGLLPVILLGVAYLTAYFLVDSDYNKMLSYRPFLYKNFLDQQSLFNYINGVSVKAFDSTFIVDNSYIHLYFGAGFVFFCVYVVLHYRAVRRLFVLNKYNDIAFIISSSSYFFLESLAVRIEIMFVIYYWYIVFLYGLRGVRSNK